MLPLKPIRNDDGHAEALQEIDRLIALNPVQGTPDFDYLETWTILVEAYETSQDTHRIDNAVDPIAAIEFHLERLGKTSKDLESILGCSRTRVWELLNRKRSLTLPMIRSLSRELGIPADRLITEYEFSAA